jgi:chromosome segregation ATPase
MEINGKEIDKNDLVEAIYYILNEKIRTYKEKIKELDVQKENMIKDIEFYTKNIQEIKNDIDYIQKRIDELRNRRL